MTERLLSLADQCETADGPNRRLDYQIYSAAVGAPIIWEPDDGRYRYTASLDTAMTLLADTGVLMSLSDIGADGLPLARVGVPGIDGGPIFTGIASCIMTDTAPVAGLALSLCAAALRARAATYSEAEV